MKKISFIFAFILSLFFAAGEANAETQSPYKLDFNTEISTSDHGFSLAKAWGHLVEAYNDNYVSYEYCSNGGVDGTGALNVGSQTFGTPIIDPHDVYDLLVTPPVTGTVSLYVKSNSFMNITSSINFYVVTKNGSTFTRGDEIKPTSLNLRFNKYVKVVLPEQEAGTLIGIRASNVYIDDFEATSAKTGPDTLMTILDVKNVGSETPECTSDGKFPVTFSVTYKNVGDVTLKPGMPGYSLDIIHANDAKVVGSFTPASNLAAGSVATATITANVDFAQYPGRDRYDVIENISKTTRLGATIAPVAYGSVSGKVTYRGAALKGASVLLSHSDDNGLSRYEAVTGEDGTYVIDRVKGGYKYSVEVSADKFVDYTSADSVAIMGDTTLTDVDLERVKVSVSGRALFHNAGVEGATVTIELPDAAEVSATTTTDSEGKFVIADVTPDYNYTLRIKKDGFHDYVSYNVAVNDTIALGDITMAKPDFEFTAVVVWGQTRLDGIKLECKHTDKDGKEIVESYYTDKHGECNLDGFDAAYVYTFTAIDESGEFTITTGPVVVDNGMSTIAVIGAEPNPVTITVESDGYTAYSYKRALDISGTGLEAYAVTDVKTNYTELAQLAAVPAKTGVLLKGNAGTYTVMPVEKAEGVDENVLEDNLLAATYDEAYTITSEKVGKEWSLTRNGGMDVFKSVAGTTVPKGSAYLGYESGESIIYLNQTDGVMSIDANRQGGALDYTKPVYNLAGQQVGKDYKGVVIQNGKKFSVK